MQGQLFSLSHTDGQAPTALPPFDDSYEVQVWSNSATVAAFITPQRSITLDAAGFLDGPGIEILASPGRFYLYGTVGLSLIAKPGSAGTASISLVAYSRD